MVVLLPFVSCDAAVEPDVPVDVVLMFPPFIAKPDEPAYTPEPSAFAPDVSMVPLSILKLDESLCTPWPFVDVFVGAVVDSVVLSCLRWTA